MIIYLGLGLTLSDLGAQRATDIEGYGGQMSSSEAEALELQLESKPSDEMIRLQLHGFYTRNRQEDSAVDKRLLHGLWLIEHSPRSEVHRHLYSAFNQKKYPEQFGIGRGLWLTHADRHKEDLAITEFAGLYLRKSDPDIAAALFQRGAGAEPEEPRWPSHLGQLRIFAMDNAVAGSDEKQAIAVDALEFFERSYQLSTERGRSGMLTSLCRASIHGRRYDKARQYARRRLSHEGGGRFGYAARHFHGHAVLGVVAFESGELEQAEKHLMLSVKLPESARKLMHEPDMSLVLRFLSKGEKGLVREFFEACKLVWKDGEAQLRKWQEQLDQGEAIVFDHPQMY
ncbi:MAG: hypothetical protein HOI66_06510 [Verrucomicrobia bacterium]|nr:hypothetical protein [Verrucomicrobiota bacterium]MDA7511620.1 hypothetical protein [Verrucomicrobiota bacterium]MDA7645559.1 hypothetical protein [bacterium]